MNSGTQGANIMIDWSRDLMTKHENPRYGRLLPPDGVGTRRRVVLPHRAGHLDPEGKDPRTTYTYSEDGICRVDGRPGDFDLVNVP